MNASEQLTALVESLKPEPSGGGMAHLDWSLDNHNRNAQIKALLPVAQFEQAKRQADALERIADALEGAAALLDDLTTFNQYGNRIVRTRAEG